MTPEEQVKDLHEAIAMGQRTLDTFKPVSLPRYRPNPELTYVENVVPPSSWVSADDLTEHDFLPGQYERGAAGGLNCPNGHFHAVADVTEEGFVLGGVRCQDCNWSAQVNLEDWDPSWALKFRMVRELAAQNAERQLSQEWAMAHARIVGDAIRGFGPWMFAFFAAFVMTSSLVTAAWRRVKHVGLWVACLHGVHSKTKGVKYIRYGVPMFVSDEVSAGRPSAPDGVKVTYCNRCLKELG